MKKKSLFYLNYSLFSREGIFEIIDFISKSKEPIKYKEFESLKNQIRGNYLSSRTISNVLKDLEENNIIEKKLNKKNSKTYVGYKLTEKGVKTIDILRETENKLLDLEKK